VTTGGVYRRADSRFFWIWYYDRQGKRRRISTKARNATQATIELRRVVDKVKRGVKIERKKERTQTLQSELLTALADQERTGAKAKTTAVKDYGRLQAFFHFCELHDVRSSDEITSDVLQEYLRWLPENVVRVSPVTANRYVDAVRGVLPERVRVHKNRENAGIGRELPQELIDAILAEATPEFRRFLILLAETGLRTGHLCAVQWSWIKKYQGRSFIQFPPELSNSRKKAPLLPLSDMAMSIVESIPKTGKHLFDDGNGQPLYSSMRVHQLWRHIRNRLGFEGRPYDLRHTFAIREIIRTGNIAYVSAMLGHSTPSTTLNYYQNLSNVRLGEIVAGANASGVKAPKTP
jgi:integrase